MRYFSIDEFDCKYSGKNEINLQFLERLDILRHRCGFPFVINSGYRDANHPEERKKTSPGTHNEGIAADIKVSDGIQRRTIVREALAMGFGGIGVANGFVHVDDRSDVPVMWTY